MNELAVEGSDHGAAASAPTSGDQRARPRERRGFATGTTSPAPSLLHLLAMLASLMVLAAVGCGSDDTGEDPCLDVDCPDGMTCVDGECVPYTSEPGGPCESDRNCPPQAPICDLDASVCRPCISDEECGSGRACDEGVCRSAPDECEDSTDCFGDSRPYCHPEKKRCVACTVDAHCHAVGQVCDWDTGECRTPVYCASDDDCAGTERPRCDPAWARCVVCLEDEDCDSDEGEVCDPAARACKPASRCESDDDCAHDPTAPKCDIFTGECVGCFDDEDCIEGTTRACDPETNTCYGGIPCSSPWDCVDSTLSRCDTRIGYCVVCMDSSDCDAPGAICDRETRSCLPPRPCRSDTDCSEGIKRCDLASGFCVECLSSDDCDHAAEVCVAGSCNAGPPEDGRPGSPCRQASDCSLPSSTGGHALCLGQWDIDWRWHQGYCTSLCEEEADCPEGSVCLAAECLDLCVSRTDCRAGYDCRSMTDGSRHADVCVPQCDPETAATIPCNEDDDCTLGVCDSSAGHCVCTSIGGACDGLGFCEPGATCVKSNDPALPGFSGGYCLIKGCGKVGAPPCPPGSSCHVIAGTTACLADCDPNEASGCPRAEYACEEVLIHLYGGNCKTSSDCPEAAPNCHAAYGEEGSCIRACSTDADCDTSLGHICVAIADHIRLCADPFHVGACIPGCTQDRDCGGCTIDEHCSSNEVCVEGACRLPCESGADCHGGNCVDGYCAKPCISDAHCPRGSECVAGNCTAVAPRCDPITRRCDTPCASDTDCDRTRICDTETGECITPCDAPGFDCGPAGRCNEEDLTCEVDCRLLDGVCGPGLYCDPVSGHCEEKCAPEGAGACEEPLRCDILTGRCVWPCANVGRPCTPETAADDCAPGEICHGGYCAASCEKNEHCAYGYTCQWGVCTTCAWPRTRCDAEDTGLCFECFDDSHCSESDYCDIGAGWECIERCGGIGGGTKECGEDQLCDEQAGGVCVTPCTTSDDCVSDPDRPHCHPESGLCGACGHDDHCESEHLPRCDPSSRQCVACLDDADCADNPEGRVCSPESSSCVACLEDADCEGHEDGPLCHVDLEICVECFQDADCPTATPICDPESHVCQGCDEHSDCPDGTYCHPGPGECHPLCGHLPEQRSRTGIIDGSRANTFVDTLDETASSFLFAFADGQYAWSAEGAEAAEASFEGFAFSIPEAALVTGFEALVLASFEGEAEAGAWEAAVTLRDADGLRGEPRTSALTDEDLPHILGGNDDMFGDEWLGSEINDTGFGLLFEVTRDPGAASTRARVDRLSLTAFYSMPADTDCAALDGGEDFYCREDNLCDTVE